MNQTIVFDELINDLIEKDFSFTDKMFPKDLLSNLLVNLNIKLENRQMKAAGIGNKFVYQRNLEVRGDVISWLDNNGSDVHELEFFKIVDDFISYLNSTCYSGINDSEFHYAVYDEGSFYKKHIDQFKSDFGRKYSMVTYLNENWNILDGGELMIYDDLNKIKIEPLFGRTVFFRSDIIEHEVLITNRQRFSIAGWLKIKKALI